MTGKADLKKIQRIHVVFILEQTAKKQIKRCIHE